MSQSIGDRIKKVRGTLGVGEFAEVLGVNRKTVTRWEADDALPDGGSLLALLQHFSANPGWVLTGDGGAPALEAAEQLLVENYRRCTGPAKANLVQTSALLAAGLGEAEASKPSQHIEGAMQIFHKAPRGNVIGRDLIKKK